jgi:hypothetical protein
VKLLTEPIQHALGIQTRDLINTSYNSGPYVVRHIHGPFTYFKEIGSIVILDHPEISLALSPSDSKQRASAYINNVREVNGRWYTALNDEVFITRPALPSALPRNLFEIIDPPDKIEFLPTPPPYQFNPNVDYEAGPRRTWHCETCNVDFNAIPTSQYWCKHNCDSQTVAQQIFYVRAPQPDDRRSYISYYVMTLNSYPYGPTKYPAAAAATAAA